MCLTATKFVLRKINSGVWFIQTFLQKMLYMPNFSYTSSTVNMQIMNQFHTHSQKKQNPTKKFIKSGQIEIARQRRRWDCAVKARSVRSSDKWRDRRSWSTSALVRRSLCSSIALLVNQRARSQSRSTRGMIDERTRRTIAPISLLPRDLIFSSAVQSQFNQIWWIFLLGFVSSVNECEIDSLSACLQLRKCVENWACKAFSVKMFEWTKHRN